MTRIRCTSCMTAALAAAALMALMVLGLAAPASAQMARRAGVAPGVGQVQLPYLVQDNTGNQWRIYQYGYLQQQGNMPLYSQGAMLMVNGNQPVQRMNVARMVDQKTGEIALEGMQSQGGLLVTRRILIDKATNVVRYVDIFKNPTGQPVSAQVTVQSSMNYGVNAAETIADPKKKDQNIGWLCLTGPNGTGVVAEVFGGKGAKTPMTVMYQQGNNMVTGSMSLNVPANKEVALVHLHAVVPTMEAGKKWIQTYKESEILKGLPTEIRKIVVNFADTQGFIGDVEILRGDVLDVVELRSGDQLKGTLKEPSYELATFYGPVTLPVSRVIGVMNIGNFRPRQLVVTTDGQIFGGKLKKESIDLQLSSGQVTTIPLSQVSRVGYRKRDGEPDEWTFEKPMVLMRSGERVGVKMPAGAIEAATRYGKLQLQPGQVAAVLLQTEESGVHQIFLKDGSKFSGLLAADLFEMKLDAAANEPEQTVKFPASSISRFQLTGKMPDPDASAPTLQLANDDMLVGSITGQLKVDTAFDTLTVNAGEIKTMSLNKETGVDVQVVLWDGSTMSGQLQQLELPVTLAGGLQMKVPVALLEEYSQPQPQPSDEMAARIKKEVEGLNSDDWKQRDRAKAKLISIGPVAIPVLKQLVDAQSDEGRKGIGEVLKELEAQRDQPKAGGGGAGVGPGVLAPQFQGGFQQFIDQ